MHQDRSSGAEAVHDRRRAPHRGGPERAATWQAEGVIGTQLNCAVTDRSVRHDRLLPPDKHGATSSANTPGGSRWIPAGRSGPGRVAALRCEAGSAAHVFTRWSKVIPVRAARLRPVATRGLRGVLPRVLGRDGGHRRALDGCNGLRCRS